MRKLNVNWPGIIAVTMALTLVSCHNDKVKKEYEQEHNKPKIESIKVEDMFQPAEKYQVDEIIFEPIIEEPEVSKSK